RMQDRTSPGHHIAVEIAGRVFQARAHHRQSPGMMEAMRAARREPGGLAESPGGQLVVGHASSGQVAVFVSEYLSQLREIVRAQLVRRLLSIVSVGVILVVVVTFLTGRLVGRPLDAVVGAVRRISRGELGTQVPATDSSELGYLADEFNSMSSALAEADRERRQEMEKARRIQNHLKPTAESYEGLSVAHVYEPATEVAGDYFDVARQESGRVVFCVADVTGHGVPAAMGAAMLKTLFHSAARQTEDPAAMLRLIHDGFVPVSLNEDFATVIIAAVDPDEGRLRYASAGHETGFLLRTNGSTEPLTATGPLLGISNVNGWAVETRTVAPGDRVAMLTDGLTEAASPTGELFGPERVRSTLNANRDLPVAELAARLVDRAAEHRAGGRQLDDVTVVLLEI
ncbi:MAG: PP2C family protein-serine/threonine phosphatase, partial [bacterium]